MGLIALISLIATVILGATYGRPVHANRDVADPPPLLRGRLIVPPQFEQD